MNSKLLAGMSEDEKEQFKHEYEKSYHFRKRVLELLKEKETALVTSMIDEDKFGEDWAYFQSTKVAAIKELRSLTNFLK